MVHRAQLLQLSAEEHVLLFAMHHIVSDGWSMGLLMQEVSALYNAYSEGRESPLAELPLQYGDYAVWQREWLQGEALERQLDYWRRQLAGAPALELPTKVRPAVKRYEGATLSFALDADVMRGLRELSRREGATLFMTLLAGFQALLGRYSGQQDISVGTPIAGRTRAETEGLVGFFVNTLVLRTKLDGDPTFRELLGRVKEACFGAYAQQDVPFERVVEELQPERDLSRTPLFQVMFMLQNEAPGIGGLRGLSVEPLETTSVNAKFDLTLALGESKDGLRGTLQYSSDLFDAATMERFAEHFRRLSRLPPPTLTRKFTRSRCSRPPSAVNSSKSSTTRPGIIHATARWPRCLRSKLGGRPTLRRSPATMRSSLINNSTSAPTNWPITCDASASAPSPASAFA